MFQVHVVSTDINVPRDMFIVFIMYKGSKFMNIQVAGMH